MSSTVSDRPRVAPRSTEPVPEVGIDPLGGPAILEHDEPKALPTAGSDAVRPPVRRRKRSLLLVLGLVALVAAVAVGGYYFYTAGYESTDDAFIEGHVVPISPQVPARVRTVRVDDNSLVKQGDILVELDPVDYAVAVDVATATETAMAGKLEQARTQVPGARATLQAAQAAVSVAQANAANAEADYKRALALNKTPGAVSKQTFDALSAQEHSTTAQTLEAQAKVAQAEASVATAEASVKSAAGDLAKAAADRHRVEVNLSYCTIRAPQAGRITRKSVEPGSYVQTGQDLFAIVPADVWVVANYKETQLADMRAGQAVTLSVDAYPDMKLTGRVDSIQSGTGSRFSMIPAENATGNFVKVVQRVPVKILLDGRPGDARPLAPGMSVEADVRVGG